MINIALQPEVHVLASTQLATPDNWSEFFKIRGIDWAPTGCDDLDAIPEFAGRVCYMSFSNPRPGGNAAYLNNIIASGHGSVLEHSSVTFLIAGVSRSLTHELVRHRSGFSYSQLSQRYVDSTDVRFVRPPDLIEGSHAESLWQHSCEESLLTYAQMVEDLVSTQRFIHWDKTSQRKAVRQLSRSVLPNSTETIIVVTANLRAWRHFIELRTHPAAEVEIRRLAYRISEILRKLAPNVFSDYCMGEDGLHVTTNYRKV